MRGKGITKEQKERRYGMEGSESRGDTRRMRRVFPQDAGTLQRGHGTAEFQEGDENFQVHQEERAEMRSEC